MSDELLELLDRRRGELAGSDWRPLRLVPPSMAQFIYQQAADLYEEVVVLPLHTLARAATLQKHRFFMRWALQQARKMRGTNQIAFFAAISDVFFHGQVIIRGVRLAEQSRELSREDPEDV